MILIYLNWWWLRYQPSFKCSYTLLGHTFAWLTWPVWGVPPGTETRVGAWPVHTLLVGVAAVLTCGTLIQVCNTQHSKLICDSLPNYVRGLYCHSFFTVWKVNNWFVRNLSVLIIHPADPLWKFLLRKKQCSVSVQVLKMLNTKGMKSFSAETLSL